MIVQANYYWERRKLREATAEQRNDRNCAKLNTRKLREAKHIDFEISKSIGGKPFYTSLYVQQLTRRKLTRGYH